MHSTMQTAHRPAHRATNSLHRPQVGNWQTVGLLGKGSWSRVFRARPAGRAYDEPADYALKIVRKDSPHETFAANLLRREAAIGRAVSHANLVAVLGGQFCDPPAYLVMPFIAGITARSLIEERGPLVVPFALWIVRQIAQALAALHEAGWMHGDVKPENILVDESGHATLIDFGLAERIATGSRPSEESTSNVSATSPLLIGTLLYAAPERFSDLGAAEGRSDVYSLGTILFELLTGRRPFVATDAESLATAHRHQIPPDPRTLAPHIPARVARLLRRTLTKDPSARPTAEQLAIWLTNLEIETFHERFAA